MISGLGRSPEGGNSNPVQYSCLGDPMDRGAWWAAVHGGHSQLSAHIHTGSLHTHTAHAPSEFLSWRCLSHRPYTFISAHAVVRKQFPLLSHSLAYVSGRVLFMEEEMRRPSCPQVQAIPSRPVLAARKVIFSSQSASSITWFRTQKKEGHEGPLRTQTVFL